MNSKVVTIDEVVDVEREVIGAVLWEEAQIDNVLKVLKRPENFNDEDHQEIMRAMMSLDEEGTSIDLLTVTRKLKERGTLEEVGGVAYLSEISNNVASPSNAEHHAYIVLQHTVKRRINRAAKDLVHVTSEESSDGMEVLDKMRQEANAINDEIVGSSTTPIEVFADDAYESVVAAIEGEDPGYSTGYDKLDQMLAGLRPNLYIVAARPSMGKTALALSLMRNMAIERDENPIPCQIHSLEMGGKMLSHRIISSMARVDSHRARSGKVSKDELDRYIEKKDLLSSSPVEIYDNPSSTVAEIRANSRRFIRQHDGEGVILIDYLQLISSTMSSDTREQEVAKMSRKLKNMSEEVQAPVVLLCQLNRSPENRSDKRPRLSDLRESGSIEQDADAVLFLYRHEQYGNDIYPNGESCEGIAEVIVAKQRNGPTDTVYLSFVKKYASFERLSGRAPGDEYEMDEPVEDAMPF